ncbi:MAG: hypothetical protein GX896_07770 [Clostridiales bacterium]|nr:hypothetical protein [Clostridiales bacterium]
MRKITKKIVAIVTTAIMATSMATSSTAATPETKTKYDKGTNGYLSSSLYSYKYSGYTRSAMGVVVCGKAGSHYLQTRVSLRDIYKNDLKSDTATNTSAGQGSTASVTVTKTNSNIFYAYQWGKLGTNSIFQSNIDTTLAHIIY